MWLVPGGIVWFVGEIRERERRLLRRCRSSESKRSKDEVLFKEGDRCMLLEDVESQDCGCGTGIINLKMKRLRARDWGVGVGHLGGSDLRCVAQTSRSLELSLSHANIIYSLTLLLRELYNSSTSSKKTA